MWRMDIADVEGVGLQGYLGLLGDNEGLLCWEILPNRS